MLQNIITFTDGSWDLDPVKIKEQSLCSFVVADRMGQEEIHAILKLTDFKIEEGNYYVQDEEDKLYKKRWEDTDFYSDIGAEYFRNQFIEIENQLVIWLPTFSEYCVVVTTPTNFQKLGKLVSHFSTECDVWGANEFWTKGEREFIAKGRAKYTLDPQDILHPLTIYVRLLNENNPVWRPVAATKLGEHLFRINEQEIPEGEEWEFLPGNCVETEQAVSGKISYNRVFRLANLV
jgi:hypothetical protein